MHSPDIWIWLGNSGLSLSPGITKFWICSCWIIYKWMDKAEDRPSCTLLQICICQPLKVILPTFRRMFIPCSKHGLLNKIITVPNLKSKLINMTELHRVNLLHHPKNSTITLHRKKLSSEKQSDKWPRQATNISNLNLVQSSMLL
jgi:hypothetical protein